MKYAFRDRHCYAKKVNGQTHYYAVYGKDTVEINKEIYDFLKQSYEREWTLEKVERKHKAISYEQLVDDIESLDRHGTLPQALCCASAEAEFFEEIDLSDREELRAQIQEEILSLSEDDRLILETYDTGSEGVKEAAQTLGISTRTIYNRRQRIAEDIAMNLSEDSQE